MWRSPLPAFIGIVRIPDRAILLQIQVGAIRFETFANQHEATEGIEYTFEDPRGILVHPYSYLQITVFNPFHEPIDVVPILIGTQVLAP